jgi:hypothetical protein
MRYNIIQRTNIELNSKDRLTESIIKKNKQLADDYEKLSDELQLCIADCERRKRDSELAGSDVPPVDKELRKELAQLDSDDDDDDDLAVVRSEIKQNEHSLRSRRRQKHRNQRRNTRRVR